MLKIFRTAGWVVLAAFVSALAVWMILGSRSFPSCISAAYADHAQKEYTLQKTPSDVINSIIIYRHCIGSFVVRLNPAITAIATTFLAIITGFLGWIARQQYLTTHAELRAYVMVDQAVTLNFGPQPKAQVTIRNFGKTPAHGLTIFTSVDVAGDPLPNKPKAPSDQAEHRGPLAPGAAVHTLDSPDRIIATAEIAAVQNGKAGFYVWGQARYDDAFGRNHVTEFCFIYGGRDGVHPQGNMGQYKDWNTST